jgi:hypothetical protein
MADKTTPEVASVQDQLTVTSVVFQPAPLGAVRPVKVMIGAVPSYLKLKVATPLTFPALSEQEPTSEPAAASGPL